jgi:predicted amidohydrolase YtcJ
MDFDDSTPDPPGGAIIRDGQPRLTGELQEVYERLQREHPASDPRFRLEHCTLINDDLLRRIKALNAIPTPSERMSIITAKRCTSTARSG